MWAGVKVPHVADSATCGHCSLFSCDVHKNAESSIREKCASIINAVSKISLDFLQKRKQATARFLSIVLRHSIVTRCNVSSDIFWKGASVVHWPAIGC